MANISLQKKRKFHIIYQTTNLVNGMIYIGAHSTDYLDDGYFGSGHNLLLAITKYGKESFSKKILYIFNTPEEMFSKEAEIVNSEFLKRKEVYNIVEGGFGGVNKGTTGLKHMHHPIKNKRCAVHQASIPKMLKEGWILGRNMSSTTNTIWIHKGTEKKMIMKPDLDGYLQQGWFIGLPKSPTSGKVWIFNTLSSEYSLCNHDDLPFKLSNGWIKKKWAPVKRGTAWINNGQENIRVPRDILLDYLKKGWKKGMITSRW